MNDEKMIHAHGGIRRENYGRKQEATYAVKTAMTKEFNLKEAAQYIAANPNKKK